MKKVILSLVLSTIFISAQAQYEPGDIDISLGTGFGFYGAKTNDSDVDTSGVNAAAGLLNLGVNYTIANNYSIGLNFERNGFLTDTTTAYGYTMNYKLNFQYRFINGEKNALGLQAGVGMSSLKFVDENSTDYVKGNGLTYEFVLLFHHYFGERFGMFINAGYGNYSYKELRDQDGDLWLSDDNSESKTFSLSGVNARIGIQFKI